LRRSIIATAVGAVLLVGLVGCGGGSTTTPPGGSSASVAPAGTLIAHDIAWNPSEVITGPGGTLTVTNEDSTTHTFTMDDGSVDQDVPAGETIQVTITTAGPFHCKIHSSMTGTVTLR
jgi:plastocyanin